MIKAIDKESVHLICSEQVILDLSIAVKELVENSLDAKATTIEIKLKDYGEESIEVVDNGVGVEPSNFQALTLKHYTSKIEKFTDLLAVSTFGFRGEALSSLCGLGHVVVITRSASCPIGTKLVFDTNGTIKSQMQCAREVGTTVQITSLFRSLPVRYQEFKRNIKKEFIKLQTILQAYALISTECKITCFNQVGNQARVRVLGTSFSTSIKSNVIAVFGVKMSQVLEEFETSDDLFTVSGLISKIGSGSGSGNSLSNSSSQSSSQSSQSSSQNNNSNPFSRSTTDRQYVYLNSRPIDLSSLSKVVNSLFQQYCKKAYPIFILNIKTPMDNYDVNVTPDKRTVFIHHETQLLELVKLGLKSIWDKSQSIFDSNTIDKFTFDEDDNSNSNNNSNNNKNSKTNNNNNNDDDDDGDSLVTKTTTTPSKKLKLKLTNNNNGLLGSSILSKVNNNNDSGSSDSTKQKPPTLDFDDDYAQPVISINHNKNDSNGNDEDDIDIDSSRDSNKKDKVYVNNKSSSKSKIDKQEKEEGFDIFDDDQLFKPNNNQKVDKDIVNSNDSHKSNNSNNIQIKKEIKTKEKKDNPEEEQEEYKQPSIKLSNISIDDINNTDGFQQKNSKTFDITVRTSVESIKSGFLKRNGTYDKDNNPIIPKFVVIHDQDDQSINNDCCSNNLNSDDYKFSLSVGGIGSNKQQQQPSTQQTTTIIEQQEQELEKHFKKENFKQMKVIGQFNLGFIIAKLGQDLFIIDQHAADEKFNYETLHKTTVFHSQPLISPCAIQGLTYEDEMVIIDHLDLFKKNGFGFVIDNDAPPRFKVKLSAIPFSKGAVFTVKDVFEMVHLLKDNPLPDSIQRLPRINTILASRACRMSIMVGTALTHQEMKNVLNNLSTLENPWCCPHGRPTMRHLIDTNYLFKVIEKKQNNNK
ncbi:hypothetical protein CYY_005047 [Polysphondylium violaceum]|uniref:MutL DNA mismatch repair protein n=1 Tax=Polysphondylium violaceum TaxID=133409 RepID=A0A8J4PTK9_9MYCE|nr:hypothetical protein CYY_005047 [Polysphondylium violaceum]